MPSSSWWKAARGRLWTPWAGSVRGAGCFHLHSHLPGDRCGEECALHQDHQGHRRGPVKSPVTGFPRPVLLEGDALDQLLMEPQKQQQGRQQGQQAASQLRPLVPGADDGQGHGQRVLGGVLQVGHGLLHHVPGA